MEKSKKYYELQALCGCSTAFSIVCVFDEKSSQRVRKFLKKTAAFFEYFAKKALKALFSLLQMSSGRSFHGPGIITGYQDVRVRIEKKSTNKKRERKLYKDMDNRERIRYYYSRYVNRQIRKGYFFKSTLTPNEIKGELEEMKRLQNGQEEIFTCYNQARYDKKDEISQEKVEEIKKLFKKY